MREIKFRAWSEDTREMIQVARLDIKEETIHYENGIKSINREQELGFWWKPYVLMQYTGLVDKRGVEIYEGDVVSMVVFEDKAEYLGDVVFENGCFCLNISLDGTKYKVTALDWKETETIITVIGDIYQNKDLLEG